jgi:SAM-dependent methyltransferase
MTTRVPERLTWAADLLNVQPSDAVLEIGCGTGVLAELICARLREGRLVGLDQSTSMIAAAAKRNQQDILDGKARFLPVALKDASLTGGRFDKAVAVNVNVFWQRPRKELATLRTLLAPTATLYLVYEPPTGDKAKWIAEQVQDNLESHGFAVQDVLFRDLQSGSIVCITAQERGQGS